MAVALAEHCPKSQSPAGKIGPAHPPLVVAEIGINHEGSLKTAIEMVDAAARAGVEVVKHQTHVVDDEMSGAAKKVVPGNAKVSIYEIMQRCALSEDDERTLQEYVESTGHDLHQHALLARGRGSAAAA